MKKVKSARFFGKLVTEVTSISESIDNTVPCLRRDEIECTYMNTIIITSSSWSTEIFIISKSIVLYQLHAEANWTVWPKTTGILHWSPIFFGGGVYWGFFISWEIEGTDRQEIEGTDNSQALSASFNFRQAVIASWLFTMRYYIKWSLKTIFECFRLLKFRKYN